MLGPFLDRAFVDEVVAPIWYDGKHSAPHRRGQLVASALDRLARMPGKRVGVELASVPAGVVEGLRAARPGLEIVDIGPVIRPLRRAKDPDEIDDPAPLDARRRGGAGRGAGGDQARDDRARRLPDRPERRDAGARRAGDRLRRLRLRPAVRDRARAARRPRGRSSRATCSCSTSRWSSPATGATSPTRSPSAAARRPASASCSRRASGPSQAGEARLKPGTPGREVDAAVRGHFASLGLDHAFTTHSGHGLGLGHPEPPYFVPESDDTLEAGDVVALEPGLYIEGDGGMRYRAELPDHGKWLPHPFPSPDQYCPIGQIESPQTRRRCAPKLENPRFSVTSVTRLRRLDVR